MANTNSAKKRIRQNEKQQARNKAIRSRARTYVKLARNAMRAGDPEASKEAVQMAISELDRAVARGVLHRNNASRRKSRLMKHLGRQAASE